MNPPQVYMCSPSWTLFPPPSSYHPSGSSQCTSPKHPVSCLEPGLATRFTYDIIHVSMPFSQIIPPSPSPTESKRLFYTSVSLLLSCIQGYCYHLSKFHIYGCEGDLVATSSPHWSPGLIRLIWLATRVSPSSLTSPCAFFPKLRARSKRTTIPNRGGLVFSQGGILVAALPC